MGTEKEIKMKYWTKEEYLKFSECVMEDPLAFYCFEVLYWSGIREGELLALTPADLNAKKRTLRIDKTYQRMQGVDVVTEPKTPNSNRLVPIPEFLCEEISEYLRQNYQISDTDRMFPVSKYFLLNKMKKYSKVANVQRIRIHDIRHSHVSLLIDLGYSAVAIAERVGHKSIDITYRYAHLFPEVSSGIAEQLNLEKEG